MRNRITYANVAATLALTLALGAGGAYAVNNGLGIPKNSINSLMIQQNSLKPEDIKNGQITEKEIKFKSLGGSRLKPKTITGEQVAGGSLTGVNAATVDGKSLNCPTGTSFYVWGCWELTTNTPANWTGAAVGCGVKGGILPGVAELAAFADQTAGVIITTPEWTSEMSDPDDNNIAALQGIVFNEPTVLTYSPFATNHPFRCVLPIIN